MKFCKIFNIQQGERQLSDERYISVKQLSSFLKDKDSSFTNKHFRRTLQSYKGGISIINGTDVVPVKSVLRYCFNHEQSKGCSFVCNSVQQEILKLNDAERYVVSSLDIYRLIAKTKFYNIDVDHIHVQNSETDENDTPSLLTEHKGHFTSDEWSKIVWFERHFSKHLDFLEQGYDAIVNLKYSKFQSLLSIKDCCDQLRNIISLDLKTREERIAKAEELSKAELNAKEKHLAHRLDVDVLSLVRTYCGEDVKAVVTFDTVNSQRHNTIQLAIATTDLQHDLADLCKTIYYHAAKRHNVHIECIYVTCEDGLKPFINGPNPARFRLRDAVESNKLTGIVYKWSTDEELYETSQELNVTRKCESCYETQVIKPLTISGFEVTSEWFNEVPIEVQLLLGVFINRKSLKHAPKKDAFLTQKLTKVHSVYDQLLNIYNRNYIGISQKANTNELLVEYKSINSVFDITSAAGTTSSLTHAEQSIKQMADEDMCYFNTYLKEHPLTYQAFNGAEKSAVSLRGCHCILMFDNLVRWTIKRNKTREDCRNNQLCTLPITLQGLPLDSDITSEWHGEDCDGSENCQCKQPVSLGREDIKRTLLELNPNETASHEQFNRLMTWSCSLLWKNVTGHLFFFS